MKALEGIAPVAAHGAQVEDHVRRVGAVVVLGLVEALVLRHRVRVLTFTRCSHALR